MFQTPSDSCRICKNRIDVVKNLGELYSCGIFPSSVDQIVDIGELAIGICTSCELVQLLEDYDHNKLYTESYGYRSSLNESMVAHLDLIAREITELLNQDATSGVKNHLDIGSNDATLLNQVLENSKHDGIKLTQLGIDPSGEGFKKYYKSAELLVEPFRLEIARNLDRKFHIISSIAMFYDLPDPNDFVAGIQSVLDQGGVWISEQSYFFRMTDQTAFDTICQEHIEYYSLLDIENLCKKADLELFHVEFNDINGGSFRFYVQHKNGPRVRSKELGAAFRAEAGRDKRQELDEMFKRVEALREQILSFLTECKAEGLEVHGYGASTKGNTLLQYFGITEDLLPFIAERNESKFGKFTPGTQIPIISEEDSKARKPHAYFVLPWHFKGAILQREGSYRETSGVKFCFPLPKFEIV